MEPPPAWSDPESLTRTMSTIEQQHNPARFAVIGNPVEHSKSPTIHEMFGKQLGIALVYDGLPAEKNEFSATVDLFFRSGGEGLNVTVPFKGEACDLCDTVSTEAQAAHAVNTISVHGGKLTGDNTDGVGLVKDIVSNLGLTVSRSSVLLLGAGGAIRGVLGPLLREGPASITIANRTLARAQTLAAQFPASKNLLALDFGDLDGHRFDIIVNGTSASLAGETLPLSPEIFTEAVLAYDMMYGPAASRFTGYAADSGARLVMDGLGMLVEQAAESFNIWHGVRPHTSEIIARLRADL